MAMAGKFLRRWRDDKTGRAGYLFYCPGCGSPHSVATEGAAPVWGFNGDLFQPTFTPSVRCFTSYDEADDGDKPKKLPNGQTRTLCHLFVRAGMIEFCSDSPHALAGKTVPLPELPDWMKG